MTDKELYDLIKPHIQDTTGLRMIIPARSNVEAPTGSYGVIDVIHSIGERGQANIIETHNKITNQVDTEVRVQAQVSVVVEFFRDNANQYARKLLQFGKYEHAQWDLLRHGFGIRGTSSVMDLTALQSSNQEERARITVELWGVYKHHYSTNIIEKVNLTFLNEDADELQSKLIDG